MTWSTHLHGNVEHKGLLPKLSQRAGLIRKLSRVMPPDRLRTIANGIYFSLLSYGIQIFGSVSGLDRYKVGSGRYQALTRDDSHKVQVSMNVVLRSLTSLDIETPVWSLLKTSGFLSFHQMCAHSTLKTAHKILATRQPEYLYEKLSESIETAVRPRRHQPEPKNSYRLSLSRESFLHQASKLLSKLPLDLRDVQDFDTFKSKSRKWVKANIPIYM